jgi:ABC-type glycerol-3-phosphate transport system substrate-binding protein
MRRRALLLAAGLALGGCATDPAETYWYHPDPTADFARDSAFSQQEAGTVSVPFTPSPMQELRYQQIAQSSNSLGDALMGGALQYGYDARQAPTTVPNTTLYQERMALRGWRAIGEEEADRLGLLAPMPRRGRR